MNNIKYFEKITECERVVVIDKIKDKFIEKNLSKE